MSGKFEIYQGKDSQYYFRLKAANGEKILVSEGYTSKAGRDNGVESVKKHAPAEANYDKKTAANGKFYFNLKSSNGQVIGSSQMYASEQSREVGIHSVRTNAPAATIVEVSADK